MSITKLADMAAMTTKQQPVKIAPLVMQRHVDFIILHCTGGPQKQTTASIKAYWKQKGWNQVGYHHLVSEDGTDEQLLPIEQVSNGVAGHNYNSINLCYKGGVVSITNDPIYAFGTPVDNRTVAQKVTLERLVRKYSAMFPNAIICGHRDFSPDKNRDGIIQPSEWTKACPSHSVAAWLSQINFKSSLPLTVLITTTNVNVREGAGTNFKITLVLPKNTSVKKLAAAGDWLYIEVQGSGKKGYVLGTYLK